MRNASTRRCTDLYHVYFPKLRAIVLLKLMAIASTTRCDRGMLVGCTCATAIRCNLLGFVVHDVPKARPRGCNVSPGHPLADSHGRNFGGGRLPRCGCLVGSGLRVVYTTSPLPDHSSKLPSVPVDARETPNLGGPSGAVLATTM